MPACRVELFACALGVGLVLAACDPTAHVRVTLGVPTQRLDAARGHNYYVQAFRFPTIDASGMPRSEYGAQLISYGMFTGTPITFAWSDLGHHTWRFLYWIDVDDSSGPPGERSLSPTPSPKDLVFVSPEYETTNVPSHLELPLP